ncbi:MAG: tetratricopeptide repeat protein, partial [Rhodospirillaceae bacterium]|nr:tetratricopeptide repeat protein [Rhodospirillaceae bacterium]
MSLVDEHGNPHSTTSDDAIGTWDRAVDIYQTYNEDPYPHVDAALEADPDFVMGHAFHAAGMLMGADGKNRPKIAERLETLNRLAPRANDRERGHIAALNAWHEGDWPRAQGCFGHVLAAYPRDAYGLHVAHFLDFFQGDSRITRDRIARVLPFWDTTVTGHNFITGLYAFALEEDGDYPRAEERGLYAWDCDNRDAWAVHALAHVYEMEGRIEDGLAWLNDTWDHWADGVFAVHNAWHKTLFHLEQGEYGDALDLYDAVLFRPGDDYVSEVHDCAALLWRLTLLGVDVSERWREQLPLWQARIGDATFAFNDMHCMMALAACGDEAGQTELLTTLEKTAEGETTNAMMTRHIGLPVCRGMQAWA